ncbi:MAG: TetR/AcrR family transcriptional regulator [Ignavibacteriales bacterium]|nr:TetR/AcrR family transcriptional regulator [Ignavibacteriales bacterium]
MRVKEGNKEIDIIEAAVKVFAKYGYHNSKISKIAETANVATGSVYVYYKNKEDILLKIFSDLWTKLYDELDLIVSNTSLSSIEKLDAMIDLIFDVFSEEPSLALVFVNEQNHLEQSNKKGFTNYYEKFLDRGEEIIKKGIDEGLISENIDLTIFRNFVFGAIRHLVHCWARDPKTFTINKTRMNVKLFIKHGIAK